MYALKFLEEMNGIFLEKINFFQDITKNIVLMITKKIGIRTKLYSNDYNNL